MEASTAAYLAESRSRQLAELIDWLRIPSISTLPEHAADVHRAAVWLTQALQRAGLEHVELIETDLHPLVYADWLHAGPSAPTLLIYGHFDVQPADPLDEWHAPPFEPTQRGDDLVARGASDDKGQTLVLIKAIEALLQTVGRLPVNVKFIAEGEEESDGESIARYVATHTAKLAADAVLISDSHMLSPSQPTLLYGLRGLWGCEITVRGAAHDLHSGTFGGVIHNANQALAELLAALHDSTGRVTVPGFYDAVRELTDTERTLLAAVPHGEREILDESGAPAIWGEAKFTVVERTGARPTLEINGMWGGFTGTGFKTVIPSEARAKVSCRLVPDQDPEAIGTAIERYLHQLAPPTVQVSVQKSFGAPAFIAPLDAPAVHAAVRACRRVYNVDPIFMREGGSIPVVNLFQQTLGTTIVLMGLGLPNDNMHAPDEKFHLPNFYRGIELVIAFLEELAQP